MVIKLQVHSCQKRAEEAIVSIKSRAVLTAVLNCTSSFSVTIWQFYFMN